MTAEKQQNDDLANTWAVIIGGGSGIGRAAAGLLARRYCGVAVLDLDEPGGVETTQLVESTGPEALFTRLDVSDHADIERAFASLPDVRVGCLVNCAGIREIRPFTELTAEEWDRVLSVNLSGAFYCIQAVYGRLLKPGASIVNLSSVSGMIGVPNRVAYCASKHGLIGLTRSLAADLGQVGVRINAVCPGVTETPMTASYFNDPELVERLREKHPIGRWGQADEIAAVVDFLCSPQSSFCTGGVYPADGGFTANKTL